MSVWPRYKSRKIVSALEIDRVEIDRHGINALVFFMDRTQTVEQVSPDMFSRYKPKQGDYLVRYEDGYLAVSPKKAFEKEYTRDE